MHVYTRCSLQCLRSTHSLSITYNNSPIHPLFHSCYPPTYPVRHSLFHPLTSHPVIIPNLSPSIQPLPLLPPARPYSLPNLIPLSHSLSSCHALTIPEKHCERGSDTNY
ncbi:hypothetical protein Pmani_020511 [Petrolisthes manimaculis]|uniref:Uncharacterized protein n=1 Tax=Petrolisthes manimaculis TaxID=1843537 RepID=A0AAE1PGI8_9EUCA|nr:hypothetical protein Pmani_020511 [Petrolisthes manimaculis]